MNKIVTHYGESDDYMYEWEEYVLVKEDGAEELIMSWSTQADCPEDNNVSRLGIDIIAVAKAAVENNVKEFKSVHHPNSRGYIEI